MSFCDTDCTCGRSGCPSYQPTGASRSLGLAAIVAAGFIEGIASDIEMEAHRRLRSQREVQIGLHELKKEIKRYKKRKQQRESRKKNRK